MHTRRAVVTGIVGLTASSCAKPCPPVIGAPVGSRPVLADAHCHLFNAKDLSVVKFLSIVVAEQYPELASQALYDPDDPTFFDKIVSMILHIAGVHRAPTAQTELALLRGRAINVPWGEEDREPRPLAADRADVEVRLVDFLGRATFGQDKADHPEEQARWREAERRLQSFVAEAGGEQPGVTGIDTTALTHAQRTAIARRALALDPPGTPGPPGEDYYIPGLFDFVVHLKRFRHCLVSELTDVHRSSGLEPVFLAPAMVDFGRWLGDDPEEKSTFVDQVAVWAEIARQPTGPAVHGYVAFCPLRQVLFDRRRLSDTACNTDPLALVEDALRTKGFLGVKVYPPMGFRAWDNASRATDGPPYAVDVLERVFDAPSDTPQNRAELGRLLDGALKRLYALCGRPDIRAPIMAHGGDSIDANVGMGKLADPWFWRGVFDWTGDVPGTVTPPAVMLAHYGGFSYRSADPHRSSAPPSPGSEDTVPFDETWEASLARYINANAGKPVFADISMLLGAIGGSDTALVGQLQELRTLCPAIEDHLVFGTDWVMLAQKRGVYGYSHDVEAVIRGAFGAPAVPKIMRQNFLRYSGLVEGPAQRRIASVYNGDTHLIERLAAACASAAA